MEKYFATYHQSNALEKLGFDLPCMATIDQTDTTDDMFMTDDSGDIGSLKYDCHANKYVCQKS